MLGLITLAIGVWALLSTGVSLGVPFLVPMGLAGWTVSLIAPGVGGAMTVALANHDTRTKEHQLLLQTPISEKMIVWGYICATLHRAWVLIGVITWAKRRVRAQK